MTRSFTPMWWARCCGRRNSWRREPRCAPGQALQSRVPVIEDPRSTRRCRSKSTRGWTSSPTVSSGATSSSTSSCRARTGAFAPVTGETVRFHGRRHEDAMRSRPVYRRRRAGAAACPAIAEFAYAKQRTDDRSRSRCPAQRMILAFWGEASREAYPDPFVLVRRTSARRSSADRRSSARPVAIYPDRCAGTERDLRDPQVAAEHESRGIPGDLFNSLGTEFVGSFGHAAARDAQGTARVPGNGTQSWIAEGGYEDVRRVRVRRASRVRRLPSRVRR